MCGFKNQFGAKVSDKKEKYIFNLCLGWYATLTEMWRYFDFADLFLRQTYFYSYKNDNFFANMYILLKIWIHIRTVLSNVTTGAPLSPHLLKIYIGKYWQNLLDQLFTWPTECKKFNHELLARTIELLITFLCTNCMKLKKLPVVTYGD